VSVMHIVRNIHAYLGETTYVFDGEPRTIKYPPLISHGTYAAVKKRAKERTLKRRAVFLATGFCDCACGAHLHQKAAYKKHVTTCVAGCGKMKQDEFEAALWLMIVNRLLAIHKSERPAAKSAEDHADALRTAEAEVAQVNTEISALLDRYLKGLDEGVWKTRNDALNDRKAHAQAEIARIKNEVDNRDEQRTARNSAAARAGALIKEYRWLEGLELERRSFAYRRGRTGFTFGLGPKRPELARQREMLADVLQGQRAVVSFGKPQGMYSPWADITLPPFGALPAVTERTTNLTRTTEVAAYGTRAVPSLLLKPKRTKAEMRAARSRAQQVSKRRHRTPARSPSSSKLS